MTRVLVVEDSPDLAFGLQTNLEIEGYETQLAEDGEAAIEMHGAFRPHLVILDLNLPRINGYGVLQAIRDRGSTVPVLILSAQQEETAKIRGFRLGADDFVTKPFSVLELMARVEALLRRVSTARAEAARADREEQQVRFGDVEVDLTARVVFRRGEKVELSPRAFELMVALLDHQGAVVRREQLLRDVWGHRNTVTTRTVDAHVLELRHKLEADPARPKHFITVRKAGYRFEW